MQNSQCIWTVNLIKVVVFTLIEIYNDDNSINHHGFERKVTDVKKLKMTKNENNLMRHKKRNMKYIAKILGKFLH